MIETLASYLAKLGVSDVFSEPTAHLFAVGLVAVLSVIANMIAKKVILRVVSYLVAHTRNQWDDALAHRRVFSRLSHIAPALVILYFAPFALPAASPLVIFIQTCAQIYMIVVGASVLFAVLGGTLDIYNNYEVSRRISITSFVQAARIIVVCLTLVLAISATLSTSPGVFLGSLAAFTAVLLLIFREPMLNLVSSIWIFTTQIVHKGDQIEIPAYDIRGEVMEISLHTVLVRQREDMTYKTVPTRVLLSEGVKNWRGVAAAGGRRIQRSIWIDMGTIRFLNEQDLAPLKRIQALTSYLERYQRPPAPGDVFEDSPTTLLVNGSGVTNIGAFRVYAEAYLRQHPCIHQGHTILVRQLQPKECGLPIEIYVATNDTRWPEYERIQADIFDHLLAVLPFFCLRVYQGLSGADIANTLAPREKRRSIDQDDSLLTNEREP